MQRTISASSAFVTFAARAPRSLATGLARPPLFLRKYSTAPPSSHTAESLQATDDGAVVSQLYIQSPHGFYQAYQARFSSPSSSHINIPIAKPATNTPPTTLDTPSTPVDMSSLTNVPMPANEQVDASKTGATQAEANDDPSTGPPTKKKDKFVPAHIRRAEKARAQVALPPKPETAHFQAPRALKPQGASASRKYDVPSKASGGVPEPTAAYLAQAAVSPSLLDKPRNILVIIDLNGTLLHRPNHKNPSRFVERPHARAFLDYCIRTFTVAIWSSARPDNVHKMLNQILSPEDRSRLVAVWGRDTLGLSPDDYNRRVQCYKRLTVMWRDLQTRLGQRWDQSNTLLVDDSREKSRTEPFNLIQLPEFKGNTQEPGYVLPQVHDYINTCAQQRDISSFARLRPFTFQPEFNLSESV